jgi:hypothetical protein
MVQNVHSKCLYFKAFSFVYRGAMLCDSSSKCRSKYGRGRNVVFLRKESIRIPNECTVAHVLLDVSDADRRFTKINVQNFPMSPNPAAEYFESELALREATRRYWSGPLLQIRNIYRLFGVFMMCPCNMYSS